MTLNTDVDQIAPAVVAKAVRMLGNVFTAMEVYAKMGFLPKGREDDKAEIDEVLRGFAASGAILLGPKPTLYFRKNNPS